MGPVNKMTKKGSGSWIFFHIKILYVLLFTTIIGLSYNIWFEYKQFCRENKKHDDIDSTRMILELTQFLKTPSADNDEKNMRIIRTEMLDFLALGEFGDNYSKRVKRQSVGTNRREPDQIITDLSSVKLQNYCRSVYDYCAGQNLGTPGPLGEKGDKGEKGSSGIPGNKGTRGSPGSPGNAGSHGVLGLKGQKGETGTSGSPGIPGSKGNIGNSGSPGPPGPIGSDGSLGKSGLKGIKGEMGLQGLLGFPGFKGEIGPSGPKGDIGPVGNNGDKGSLGPVGPQGPSGDSGIKGELGRRGKKGDPGKPGIPGRLGVDGIPGVPGLKGEKGDRGVATASALGVNCSCQKGDVGEKGQRGLIGFTGYKGDAGDSGSKGETGYLVRGYPGPRGPAGQKGDKGRPGEKGCCLAPTTPLSYWTHTPSSTYSREETTLEQETTHGTRPPQTRTTTTSTTTTAATTTPSPTLGPRKRACRVKMVGIPLFERQAGPKVGSWLRDPLTPDKIWVTKGWHGEYIYEYSSIETFLDDEADRTHYLSHNRYRGTNHAMYNGSIYFHRAGHHVVVRYDLKRADVVSFQNMYASNYDNHRYLYATGKNYYDISIDENGLWVIYAKENTNSTLSVKKLDPFTMQVLKTWDIDVNHQSYGNGFVICGILYLVRSVNKQRTFIDYAYDLYTDKVIQVHINFINPYSGNAMLSYIARKDPRQCRIYGWDMGYQISYQLLFG